MHGSFFGTLRRLRCRNTTSPGASARPPPQCSATRAREHRASRALSQGSTGSPQGSTGASCAPRPSRASSSSSSPVGPSDGPDPDHEPNVNPRTVAESARCVTEKPKKYQGCRHAGLVLILSLVLFCVNNPRTPKGATNEPYFSINPSSRRESGRSFKMSNNNNKFEGLAQNGADASEHPPPVTPPELSLVFSGEWDPSSTPPAPSSNH